MKRFVPLFRALALSVMFLLLAPLSHAAEGEDLDAQLAPVRAWQLEELGKLAKTAEAKGDSMLVARCALHARTLGEAGVAFADAKAAVASEPDSPKLSAKTRDANRAKFGKYREQAGAKVGAVALWCKQQGLDEHVPPLAREALDLDPDAADAQAALGRVHVKRWGWATEADAARLKKKLLPVGDEWLSRRTAIRRRSKWPDAWEVESHVWSIRSNLDLDRLLELRGLLDLHYQRFLDDWEGFLPLRERKRKFRVLVFASEDDYTQYLRDSVPGHIVGVPGQYIPRRQEACFYDVEVLRSEGQQVSTLVELMLHECTHQLFRELVASKHANIENHKNPPNFWVHEGISEFYAMLSEKKGRLVRDPKHVRAQLRTITLRKNLRSMLTMAQLDEVVHSDFLSRDMEVRRVNYAQAGFVCVFFDQPQYRPGFSQLLRDVYCGKNEPGLIKSRIDPQLGPLNEAFVSFVQRY